MEQVEEEKEVDQRNGARERKIKSQWVEFIGGKRRKSW